jgi:hypothetical protein
VRRDACELRERRISELPARHLFESRSSSEVARGRHAITLPAAEVGGEAQADGFDEVVNRRLLREMGAVGDFVGVQNCSRLRFGPDGLLPHGGG